MVANLIALILLLFVARGPTLAADPVSVAIKQQGQKLQEIEEELTRHKAKVEELQSTAASIAAELERLDRRIMETWRRLKEVKGEWTRKELELERVKEEVNQARKRADALKGLVEKRLLALQRFGTLGILNVLFSSSSFPELMARKTYLEVILDHDARQREEFRRRIHSLLERENRLDSTRRELERLARQVEEQAEALEERKQERLAFLKEIQGQKEKYEALVAELSKAKERMMEIIGQLEEEQEVAQAQSGKGFAGQKGRLNPPVLNGTIILNSPLARGGILISAPMGSEVRAIFDGTVEYAGEIKGLGKVVILDHGQSYYSLVAQCLTLMVHKGDRVVEGDVVALSGTGALVDPGVYFALRHRTTSLDPEAWLDLKGMRVER